MATNANIGAQLLNGNYSAPDPSASGTTSYDPNGYSNFGTIDPGVLAALQAAGWTGGNPIADIDATGNPETGGAGYDPGGFKFSPQFQQWMQQNGISPQITAGSGNSQNLAFYGPNGQIGQTQNKVLPSDMDAFLAGAGGIVGFGALSALGGAGASSAVGGETGGGIAGTGLPEYSAYTGAGSGASSALAGDATGTGIFDAAGAGGLSSADAAALYGPEGYGAAASPAELAAAGGTSLSDLASGVGSFLTKPGNTSLVGGALGALGSIYAGTTQANAATNAADLAQQNYQQTRADQAPWRAAGATALSQLTAGTAPGGQFTHAFDANDLTTNLAPNYQFMLSQGQQANQNAAGVSGGLVGGNALQGLDTFTQNYAQNAYQQAFDNYNTNQTNIYNRLANIAGLGQQANQSTDTLGTQATENANNFGTSAAASTAAGVVGGTNAVNNGINNSAGWNYLSSLAQGGTAGGVYSDRRLKTDISQVGKTDEGLPIYTYRYKAGGPTQMGVMAQDVAKVKPKAVRFDPSGYMKVNYAEVA